MTTPPTPSQAARDAAEKLHRELSALKGEWVVHPSSFLPANVECDYGGKCNFDAILASHFQQAIDAEVASAVAESEKRAVDAERRYKVEVQDWAETDTAVRQAALRVLTEFEVNGDSYGVPSVEDIVDKLVAKVEEQRSATADLRAVLIRIAKPALGGKEQQWMAQQALKDYEAARHGEEPK